MKQLIFRTEYDPMGISGCVLWLPHDQFRYILPTGHRLQRWNEMTPSSWEYVTYGGKKCVHHTSESAGSYVYALNDAYWPMTAGWGRGNGCTFSWWIYGRTPSTNNPFQVYEYDTQVGPDDPDGFYFSTYGTYNSKVLLSSWTSNGWGGFNEYVTGQTSNVVIASKANSLLTTGWNCIQVTCTAAGAVSMYCNGTARGTGTVGRPGWIGLATNAMPNRTCTGYFRQYRIYNRVLTSNELTKLRSE